MGSLGVIVAASFKVYPRPMHDVTVSSTHESIEEALKASDQALAMPLAPAALELFSDGRVLARFFGSPDAVNRMVKELDWKPADASAWIEHSRRGPESWARISVPRQALRSILAMLPKDASWWASPGLGVAHWSFAEELDSLREIRAAAERAQGSLVVMAAPADVTRRLSAWGTTPATIQLMRRLKHAFDPDGILNPGRFVV
jgi:glycolate oxidase FAD binding subunit